MIHHMSVKITHGIEDLATFIAGYFLLDSVNIVNMVPQSRVTVKTFFAMWTFIFPLSVVNIACTTINS